MDRHQPRATAHAPFSVRFEQPTQARSNRSWRSAFHGRVLLAIVGLVAAQTAFAEIVWRTFEGPPYRYSPNVYPNAERACIQGYEDLKPWFGGWDKCAKFYPATGGCAQGNPPLCEGIGSSVSYSPHDCGANPVNVQWDPNGVIATSCSADSLNTASNLGKETCTACFGTNPSNVATGNKYELVTDYVSADGQLKLVRAYNSMGSGSGRRFGPNWTDHYERRLTFNGQVVRAQRPDGRIIRFTSSGTTYSIFDLGGERLEPKLDGGGATVGYLLTDDDANEADEYDLNGVLQSISNRAGLKQTMTYSDGTTPPSIAPKPGLLIRVTDAFGRQLNFTLDSEGKILTAQDPAGQTYTYSYNPTHHNVSQVLHPGNKTRIYHYENTTFTWLLTGITDENGDRYATWGYDSLGRANLSEHAGHANRIELTFNAGITNVRYFVSYPSVYADRTLTFAIKRGLSQNTGITGAVCPECGPASRTYDANGYPASSTDWSGNRTCFKTDSARALELVRGEGLTAACPADLSTWTPTGGTVQRKINTEWHPTWRLPTKICEPKRITTLAYDTKGNLTSRSVQATNDAQGALGCSAAPIGTPRTWTSTYTYGTTNPAVATQIVVNGPRTDVVDTATYVYEEPTGNLLSVTNAVGHQTTLGNYDAHGKPRQVTDPNGLVTTLVWDERQRLLSRTVGSQVTGYTYDGVGQLTRITLPDASYIEYVYDDAHRLTEVHDNLGNKVTYTLDAKGNRTAEETRDPAGTLKATRTREYNTLNRLIKDIGGTNPAVQITQYGYDNQGNLTSIDGPLTGTPNDLSVLTYDALNRLKDVTNPLSGITRYGYDGLDQIASVTDPRNNATGYTVSGLGDQTQEVSPDRGTTNRLFDAAGNLTSSTDARSKTTTYTYDALNRLTQASFQGANPITYAWDQGTGQKGRLTTITFPGGNTTYTYDAQGRVSQKTDTHSTGRVFTVTYAWNATTGRLTSITYPKGKVLTFGYDAAGRVTSLSVGSAIIATNIAYFPFGPPSGWSWGNSLAVARSFDLDGRLTGFPLTTTDSRNVTYDAASRITEIKHPTNPALAQTMGYDQLDRLTSWVDASSVRNYGYDANGNRTSLTIGGTNYTYTTPAATNGLGSTSGPSPARSFLYDGAGNTTGDGQFTLTYNDRGRLVQAVKGSTTATYTLDGLGQRVKKTGPTSIVPSGTNYFVYDEQGKLLGEYNSSGALISEYVWLGTTPIAVLQGSTASPTIFYVYADQIDRPWVITNTANQIRWRWDTSPFGELAANENPSGLGAFKFNLRFPGQYRDGETGLFYNYYRDYDPQTGRYVQSDPIGLRGGLNTYAYANLNPLTFVDLFGLVGDDIGGGGRSSPPIGIPNPSWEAQRNLAKQLERLLCPPACLEQQARIKERANELRERYFRMLNDPKDLFTKAYCQPSLGRRIGTWLGHGDQITQLRKNLAELIAQADAMNCPVDPQDRDLLRIEPPGCPAAR